MQRGRLDAAAASSGGGGGGLPRYAGSLDAMRSILRTEGLAGALHCITLRCYVTLRYVTLRYVKLRYVTLRYSSSLRTEGLAGALTAGSRLLRTLPRSCSPLLAFAKRRSARARWRRSRRRGCRTAASGKRFVSPDTLLLSPRTPRFVCPRSLARARAPRPPPRVVCPRPRPRPAPAPAPAGIYRGYLATLASFGSVLLIFYAPVQRSESCSQGAAGDQEE